MKNYGKKKLDAKEDFEFVLVLSKEYYDKNHIPGSKNIPLDQLEEQAPKEFPDKGREIVVYCASLECQASPKAAKQLEEMGYTNVSDFESGVQGWKDAGFKLEGTEA